MRRPADSRRPRQQVVSNPAGFVGTVLVVEQDEPFNLLNIGRFMIDTSGLEM